MNEKLEVVVAGGGPAGIAAAITAARAGARTLLVERSDIVGGNAGNALVHTICGLYLPDRDTVEPAHSGFPTEFADALLRRGAAAPVERAGRVYVLPTFPHRLAETAAGLCCNQRDLEVWRSATVVAAHDGVESLSLTVERDAERIELRAAIVIDTTGDATIAFLCGAAVCEEAPHRLQTPSFIFRVRGVDPAEAAGFGRMRVAHSVARAAIEKELPATAGSILVRPGPSQDEAYITLNLDRPVGRPYAPLDEDTLAALAACARNDATALVAYLRSRRPGFAECEVVEWPRRVGVRETRRVQGLETVSEDDVLTGRRRADEVALSTWPIELWHDRRGARFRYPTGESSVPLGALISRDQPRLGMAGRCLSASHEALGALRVIGTALATGEAIGRAAALAAGRSCTLHEIAADEVRQSD